MNARLRPAVGRLLTDARFSVAPSGGEDVVRQGIIMMACYATYDISRALAQGREAVALANGVFFMNQEKGLGIWWEPWIQGRVSEFEPLMALLVWAYSSLHLPLIIATMVWVFTQSAQLVDVLPQLVPRHELHRRDRLRPAADGAAADDLHVRRRRHQLPARRARADPRERAAGQPVRGHAEPALRATRSSSPSRSSSAASPGCAAVGLRGHRLVAIVAPATTSSSTPSPAAGRAGRVALRERAAGPASSMSALPVRERDG